MNDEINLKEYFEIILKRWKSVVLIALVVTLFVFVSTSRQKPVYMAKTTLLVRGGGGSSLSQYSGLANLAGIDMSSKGKISELMQLLQTRKVAAKVVEDLKLRDKIKGWDDPSLDEHQLAAAVQGLIKNPKADGNLVKLRVEYTDPELTAEILNGFTKALSYYWNELNYTEASKKKQYIESQLPRVKKELAAIEKKIKSFTLLGLTKPTVEYKRLEREFEIQNSVYTMLRNEYEAVKLEGAKEIPPFSVIDEALVPKSPFKPRIKLYTRVGLVLGIFLGGLFAFLQEYVQKTKRK